MSALEIVGAITAVLAFLGALGLAAAIVRGSYNKARIEALKGDVDDLRDRLEDCDTELAKSKTREDALKTRNAHLSKENESLTKLVTQKANVDQVLSELEAHHAAAKTAWTNILTILEPEVKK